MLNRLNPERYIAEADEHLAARRFAAFEIAHVKAGILLGQRDAIKRYFGSVKAGRLLAQAESELEADDGVPQRDVGVSLHEHRLELARHAAQRVYVTCQPSGVSDYAQEMARSAIYKASVDHHGLHIGLSWFTEMPLAEAQRSGATILCQADQRLAGMALDGDRRIHLNREFAKAEANSVYEIALHEARHVAQDATGMPRTEREEDARTYAAHRARGY